MVDVSDELPKSFVLTEEFGMERVYLTQFNAAALRKAPDGIETDPAARGRVSSLAHAFFTTKLPSSP